MSEALDKLLSNQLISSHQCPDVASTLFELLAKNLVPFDEDASGRAADASLPPTSFLSPRLDVRELVRHSKKLLQMVGKLLLDKSCRDFVLAHLQKFITSQGNNGKIICVFMMRQFPAHVTLPSLQLL